jgi:hypothetical protein
MPAKDLLQSSDGLHASSDLSNTGRTGASASELAGKNPENLRLDFLRLTLLFSFVPLGILWLLKTIRGNQPDWIKRFGAGDLLLITAVLCADAFGKIVTLRELNVYVYYAKVVCTVLAGSLVLVASIYFAIVAVQIEERQNYAKSLAQKAAVELTTSTRVEFSLSRTDLKAITEATLNPPVAHDRVALHSLMILLFGIAVSIGAILMEED